MLTLHADRAELVDLPLRAGVDAEPLHRRQPRAIGRDAQIIPLAAGDQHVDAAIAVDPVIRRPAIDRVIEDHRLGAGRRLRGQRARSGEGGAGAEQQRDGEDMHGGTHGRMLR